MINKMQSPDTLRERSQVIHRVSLSGDLRIRDVERVTSELKGSISENSLLMVEMDELLSIDISIFQVLVALAQTAKNSDFDVCFQSYVDSPIPQLMIDLGVDPDILSVFWKTSEDRNLKNNDEYNKNAINSLSKEGPTSKSSFWLKDDQMKILMPFLPENKGRQRTDDRRVLSGIIYIKSNGLRWKDAPREYGPYKTLYTRWKRWSRSGVFEKIVNGLKAEFPDKNDMIESTGWLLINENVKT